MKTLKLDQIRIDGGTQTREKINEETVAEYAERYQDGDSLAPIEVLFDGVDHWLVDGFHRWHARARAGFGDIECRITKGTQRDAILKACGANANHGLKRTNADKRKSVKILLSDKEWSARADRWVAEACGVSHTFVAEIRSQTNSRLLATLPVDEKNQRSGVVLDNSRQGRDGKVRSRQEEVREFFEPKTYQDTFDPEVIEGNGKASKKEKKQTPAKLVDELTNKFVSPLVRGIDRVAEVNGGKGEYHEQANGALRTLIAALKQMRKGEQ